MTTSERRRGSAAVKSRPSPGATPARSEPPGPGGVFPSARELLDPRGPFLIPLLLLLTARVGLWIANPYPSEDAFITFRYARNFASGQTGATSLS